MKTLFVTSTYLKGDRGVIYASRTHINLFAELSEEFTLIYPYKIGMEPEGINTKNINFIPFEDLRSKPKKIIDFLFGNKSRYVGRMQNFINPQKYDVVVFDDSVPSSRIIKLFVNAGIKAITIHHNYEIEFIKGDSNLLLKYPDLFWTYFQEKNAVTKSYLNLSLTKQDAFLLKKHYCDSANFEVLGVFDYQRKSNNTIENRERGHNYLITGGLGSKQNEDSLIPWLTNFFPILRKIDPKSTLRIAGRSPSERLKKKAEEVGAEIIDSPADMKPILDWGDYYICPTDRGGGLKLRILDGLKGGMPVICHEVSARGYDRFIEANIVYSYSDKQTFENELRKMISNPISRPDIHNIYYNNFNKSIKNFPSHKALQIHFNPSFSQYK